MTKEQWVWMPHPAHFIGSSHCGFRLATYVGGYIVSTVGELFWSEGLNRITAQFRDPQWLEANGHLLGDNFQSAYFERFGYDEVGLGRLYETMVFRAIPSEQCDSCPWVIDGEEQDYRPYNVGADAYAGHMELCEKWADHEGNAA
jgi:hypothetical protein